MKISLKRLTKKVKKLRKLFQQLTKLLAETIAIIVMVTYLLTLCK